MVEVDGESFAIAPMPDFMRRMLDAGGPHPVAALGGRVMRIRAAVLREMGLPGAIRRVASAGDLRVELDEPGPGEMLVKIGAAGLCHSDLSVIDGSRPRVMPMVLGHEAAGTVVSVGSGGRAVCRR